MRAYNQWLSDFKKEQGWKMPVLEYKKGEGRQISVNFNSREFDCPCDTCRTTLVDPALVQILERIRTDLGTPLRITSGYRCENYQKELTLKGYETAKGISQHQLGRAADITNDVALGIELEELAAKAGIKAIGVGKHFVHIDLRGIEDGKVRRWTYSY